MFTQSEWEDGKLRWRLCLAGWACAKRKIKKSVERDSKAAERRSRGRRGKDDYAGAEPVPRPVVLRLRFTCRSLPPIYRGLAALRRVLRLQTCRRSSAPSSPFQFVGLKCWLRLPSVILYAMMRRVLSGQVTVLVVYNSTPWYVPSWLRT